MKNILEGCVERIRSVAQVVFIWLDVVGMMAANGVHFDKIEARAVMKFLFLQGKGAKEVHEEMLKILKDECPSYSTVKTWVARFRTGHFDVADEPRSGRPTSATTEDKVDAVHDLILEDRRISAKNVAETVGISKERILHIIHNILNMHKLSAKWVPKCLNADQKRSRVISSKAILKRFRAGEQEFLARLVTMDETWLHHYDPTSKQQAMEWRHSGSPRPQKFRVQRSAGKVMASVFWDKDGVLLINYLPKGQSINAQYYTSLLDELKQALKEKRRGKLRRGVLFLQDNAPAHTAHITLRKLEELGFELVDHPPYSPDLAPSDYYLFPQLKKDLKGTKFGSNEDVIRATEAFLEGKASDFYLTGLKKLKDRCVKCVDLKGEYVE